MAGFENNVLVAKNLNFDEAGSKPHLGIINAAGKFPIGTGNSQPTPEILAGTITSPDSSITIGYSSPNITLVVAGGTSVGKTITGNSGGAVSPTAGNWNLLGGTGCTVVGTPGTSTLTINVATTGFTWNDVGASLTITKENGYFVTAAATLTLPPANQGDTVIIAVDTTSSVIIQAGGGQTIRKGTSVSSSGGTMTNSARGDTMELVFRGATLQWIAISSAGAWTAA